MPDIGHEQTEEILKALEKEISQVYKQAAEEMEQKVNDQMAKYAQNLAKQKKLLEEGKITKDGFNTWKKNQAHIIANKSGLKDVLATDFVNADKIAADLIGSHMSTAYAINYNYGAYQIETEANLNTSFVLYDHDTVERLLVEKPELLPKPKINIPKDMKWNKAHIGNAITQGILQGESIPDVAKRLQAVTDMDHRAAIRNARTSITSAQNGGRTKAYKRAAEKGIKTKKEWVATLDGRTRHTHRELDGQRVELDDKFEVDGKEIEFPGDPYAHPSLTYNCRCTIIPVVKGHEHDNSWKEGEVIDGVSYANWKNPPSYADWLVDQAAADANIVSVWGDKKYGYVYNLIKDSKNIPGHGADANNFYYGLKKIGEETGLGKPPEVWTKYLAGELDADDLVKIEDILNKYLPKQNIGTADINPFAGKAWSDMISDPKLAPGQPAMTYLLDNYDTDWSDHLEAWANSKIKDSKLDEFLLGKGADKIDDISDAAKAAEKKISAFKGSPMDVEHADNYKVNQFYNIYETDAMMSNCQSASFAYECRRQGYDVVALPKYGEFNKKGKYIGFEDFEDTVKHQTALGADQSIGWINKTTGKHPEKLIGYDKDDMIPSFKMYQDLADNVGVKGERYILSVQNADGSFHAVNIDRDEKGLLRLIDNQVGPGKKNVWTGSEITTYFNETKNIKALYRVDDCVPDPTIFGKVVKTADEIQDKKGFTVLNNLSADKKDQVKQLITNMGKDPDSYYAAWKCGIIKDDEIDKILGLKTTTTTAKTTAKAIGEGLDMDVINGKSASAVWKELNANKAGGGKFWSDITDIGKANNVKPAEAWKKYLAGELDADETAKIEGHLAKIYAKTADGTGKVDDALDAFVKKWKGKDLYDNDISVDEMDKIVTHIQSKGIIDADEVEKYFKDWANGKVQDENIAKILGYKADKANELPDILKKIDLVDPNTGEVLDAAKEFEKIKKMSITDLDDMAEKLTKDYYDIDVDDAKKILKESGLNIPEKKVADKTAAAFDKSMVQGKSMSAVVKELKEQGSKVGNDLYYKVLQPIGKPSEVWDQYLKGELTDAQNDFIEDYLKKYYGNKIDNIIDYSTFGGKEIYDILKNYDNYNEFLTAPNDDFNTVLDFFGKNKIPGDAVQEAIDEIKKLEKANATAKTVATKAAAKTVEKSEDLIKAEAKLKKAEDDLKAAKKALKDNVDTSVKWSGIWKEDVTLDDYVSKKSTIAAKKNYYEDEIDKLKNDPSYKSFWDDEKKKEIIEKCKGYIDDLDEYDQLGKYAEKYYKDIEKAKNTVTAAQKEVNKLKPSKIDPADYSDAAKSSTKFYTSANDADKVHRAYLDSIWDDLTDEEKYGVWEYTRNSHPMNKSLSGYHDEWDRSHFKGYDKTDWGHEDSWRKLPYSGDFSNAKKYGKNGTNNVDYHKAITDTTTAIEKSILPQNTYLVRGSGNDGFAGWIEGKGFMSYDDAFAILESGDINQIKAAFEGQVVKNHAFTSTGIAKGTGFGGQVKYEIYAPKGTKAIYLEPQSHYGETAGYDDHIYKPGEKYYGVGGEAEILVQRGTEYRITEITGSPGHLTVKVEVVDQPDYFEFGDEDTFNNGATRHKK